MMRCKVLKTLVLDPIHQDAVEYGNNNLDLVLWDEVREKDFVDAEAVIVRVYSIDKQIIDKMKSLKIIAKHGVGVDNIDIDYAKKHNIIVTNTPTANMESVAEFVIGLTLNCCRKVLTSHKKIEEGLNKIAPSNLSGYELSGKNVGLIGLGKIGKSVGRKFKSAFNMKVQVYDPFTSEKECKEEGFSKINTLAELLRTSDIVNISVPLTQNTKNMISYQELKLMKTTGILINTSRGGIVDEDALYETLSKGHIFGAAIDAFSEEPVKQEHKLLSCSNFIATPHNGANTVDALKRMGTEAIDEVVRCKNSEDNHSIL
jgi:D-3-phosphoglycerate dehydrogenase